MPIPIPPLRATTVDADVEQMFFTVRRGIIASAVRGQHEKRMWPSDKEHTWCATAEKWERELFNRYPHWSQQLPEKTSGRRPKTRPGGRSPVGGANFELQMGRTNFVEPESSISSRSPSPESSSMDALSRTVAQRRPDDHAGFDALSRTVAAPDSEEGADHDLLGRTVGAAHDEVDQRGSYEGVDLLSRTTAAFSRSPSKKAGWIEAARKFSKASAGAVLTRASDENAAPLSVEETMLSQNILEEISAKKKKKAGQVEDSERGQVPAPGAPPASPPETPAARRKRERDKDILFPNSGGGSSLFADFGYLIHVHLETQRRYEEAELARKVELGGRLQAERALKAKVVLLDQTESLRSEYQSKFKRANFFLCKERFIRFWMSSEFLKLQERFEELQRKYQKAEVMIREKKLLVDQVVKKNSSITEENKQMYEEYVKMRIVRDKQTQTEVLPASGAELEPLRRRPSTAMGNRGFGSVSPGKRPSTSGAAGGVEGATPSTSSRPASSLTQADMVHFTCKILFSFVRDNNLAMIKESLQYLKDVNVRDRFGDSLLTTCCKCNQPDLLRYFLAIPEKWGGALSLKKEINDGAILSFAAQANFASDVVQKLLNANADPNHKFWVTTSASSKSADPASKAKSLEAPLVYAVANNSEKVVKLLLISAANPNLYSKTSALRWAVRSDNAPMVNLLLRADADIISEERLLLQEADSDRLRQFLRNTIRAEKIRLGHIIDNALQT
ncbi:unnamed protein product [Amoebophrya sp. A120]|nr:unnamed protein product [Amoebophrya sp. A120]|eukprot:GSA120T00018575001.1